MNASRRQDRRAASRTAHFTVTLPTGTVEARLPLDWTTHYQPIPQGSQLADGDVVITAAGSSYHLCSGFFGDTNMATFTVGAKGERCPVGHYFRRGSASVDRRARSV